MAWRRRSTTAPAWLLGAALTVMPACAALHGAVASQRHIQTQTEAFEYDRPPAAVLPHARQVLFEMGFVVTSATDSVLETEWLVDDDRRTRLLLLSTPTASGCRVAITRAQQTLDDDGWSRQRSWRDFRTEFILIDRVAPEQAARIRDGAARARADAQAEAERSRG